MVNEPFIDDLPIKMNIVHSYMMLYVKLPTGNVCMWFSQGFPDRPPGRYTEWHPWRLQQFLMEFTIQELDGKFGEI
jgi:hypothetical protein